MGKFEVRKCVVCGNHTSTRYKAMTQWNIEGDICGECYEKKLTDHYISIDRRNITKG